MHVQEGLMQVGLCIFALGLELLGDEFPAVLSTGTVDHVHNGGVREALGQEVAGHSVLMFPSLTSLNLSISGVFDVFRPQFWLTAIKVTPLASDPHGVLEAHHEDGLV